MTEATLPPRRADANDTGVWKVLHTAYKIAKVEFDLFCARPGLNSDVDAQRRCRAHAKATDALLMTPAGDLNDLRDKIVIIDREDIHDGWPLANEIMALLACDADRLLAWPEPSWA